MISNNMPVKVEKGGQLSKRLTTLAALFLVIAITATLFFFRGKVAELGNYGYLGAFLISLVSNATIILPVPGFLLLFALGATFNPILVGLAAAAGGTIGEITSYVLGYTGRGILENRTLYEKAVHWLKKWGALTVFVFAATPLPLDVMGMVAGVLRFPLWRFIVACWFGKSVKYIAVALAGAWGFQAILRFFGW